MTDLFLSLSIAAFLHLFAMAVTAKALGVKVVEFSYGVGPKIFRINNNIIKLIPIAGYVKMADSREQDLEESELQFAYDHKSRFIRSFIPISGCLFLVLTAFLLIGSGTFDSLVDGFRQIVTMVLSPTEAAQDYIESVGAFMSSNSLPVIFAVTATKMSAVNLLPIPVFNGGQAILELFDFSEKNKLLLFQIGLLVALVMLLSIVIAIIHFVWF